MKLISADENGRLQTNKYFARREEVAIRFVFQLNFRALFSTMLCTILHC